ncbi:MAG TPA: hypothetical protein VM598_08805 [Bdellovibrionota bacterium]|nr:hypothetical protein [Bdellovibrionota bacterium]
MELFRRALSIFLATALITTPAAQAASVSSGARLLSEETRKFRTAIDSGIMPADQAIREFTVSLAGRGLRAEDVSELLREKLGAREHAAFQARLDASLRGIDPGRLTPDELGEIAASALSESSSRGLSWSACQGYRNLGIASIAVAALFVVISIKEGSYAGRFAEESEKELEGVRARYSERMAGATTAAEVEELKLAERAEMDRLFEEYDERVEPHDDLMGLGMFVTFFAGVAAISFFYKADACENP